MAKSYGLLKLFYSRRNLNKPNIKRIQSLRNLTYQKKIKRNYFFFLIVIIKFCMNFMSSKSFFLKDLGNNEPINICLLSQIVEL